MRKLRVIHNYVDDWKLSAGKSESGRTQWEASCPLPFSPTAQGNQLFILWWLELARKKKNIENRANKIEWKMSLGDQGQWYILSTSDVPDTFFFILMFYFEIVQDSQEVAKQSESSHTALTQFSAVIHVSQPHFIVKTRKLTSLHASKSSEWSYCNFTTYLFFSYHHG